MQNSVRWVIWLAILIPLFLFLWSTFGTIETGNVGVRKTLGTVSTEEVPPGVYFRVPLIQTVTTFVAKETSIEMNDLKPKAKDNLSLQDLDVTVFYKVSDAAVADLYVRYAGQHVYHEGHWYPAYSLVATLSRNAIYEAVAKLDSLVLHTRRDDVANDVHNILQAELDKAAKGVFNVTRIVIRSLVTDTAIEQSIRAAVAAQKQLEQADINIKIANKNAEAEIAKAQGIAKANQIINHTLTREYLQHESNLVLQKFAEKGGSNTVILPANMTTAPLIQLK